MTGIVMRTVLADTWKMWSLPHLEFFQAGNEPVDKKLSQLSQLPWIFQVALSP